MDRARKTDQAIGTINQAAYRNARYPNTITIIVLAALERRNPAFSIESMANRRRFHHNHGLQDYLRFDGVGDETGGFGFLKDAFRF